MRTRRTPRAAPRAAFRYLAEDAPSGYGDAADRLVRALRQRGVHVEYRGWSSGRGDEPPAGVHAHRRDDAPEERAPRHAPTIAHVYPEHLPAVRDAMGHGPLVAHTVWETDRLPAHWPDTLNQVERVIVPTEWNRDVIVASGVTVPVGVVPHVACDPVPGDGGRALGLPADVVVFYTISRWDERKAPAAVIRAFLEAFTADDPVALVVKTTPRSLFSAPGAWGAGSAVGGTTMLEVARIMRDHPHPPLVRVEVDEWAPDRIAGLHSRCDCYVSLAHGEGWGLGAFDAVSYGNPVVMTGWGGQLAYLDADGALLVDHDLEPVQHSDPRVYSPDQRWAVPRVEHAVELLREVAADLGAARRRAAPLRAKVQREFSAARVVAALADAVPELGIVVEPAAATTSTGAGDHRVVDDELLLVGLAIGDWRTGYDNWVEMAERFGYRHELLGREVVEPYVPHATKLEYLRDYFDDLPRTRLVFFLDSADAFVCDRADATLARYRSHDVPVVFGAERGGDAVAGDEADEERWRFANGGGYVGEAGVIADSLRVGYGLQDWEQFGRVSDQKAMRLYFDLPQHRHLAVVDRRRTIVQNIAAGRTEEYDAHLALLNRARSEAARPLTSSVHFFGDNGPGYNAFARLYGLTPHALHRSGRFRAPGQPRQ